MKEENPMKEEKHEREIVTVGEPDLQKLEKKGKDVLFSVLLRLVLENYMETKTDTRSDFQSFPENLDYRTIVRRRSVFKKKHRILFAQNPMANEKNTR